MLLVNPLVLGKDGATSFVPIEFNRPVSDYCAAERTPKGNSEPY